MDAGGPVEDVQVGNVSAHGMMIRASSPPKVGSYVEVIAGDVTAVGRVRWRSENCFGIVTRDRVPVVRLVFRGTGKLVRPTSEPASAPPAAPAPEAMHGRSRVVGRTMEFGLIAAALIAVGALVGGIALGALSAPLATIAAALR